MASVRPFRALRPRPELAPDIAAVPYDVVSTEEARALARDRALSFLHVSRAEIDLPPDTNLYADAVYERAAANFAALKASMIEEPSPAMYFYRLRMGAHEQTGLAACYSVGEYNRDIVKKHEKTRKEKEDDRTRHIVGLRAQTGPVFLTYKHRGPIDALAARVCAGRPLYDFTTPDDVQHALWTIDTTSAETIVGGVREAAGRVHRRRAPPGGQRRACARSFRQRRQRGRARVVPRRRVPRRPDADPALQPAGEGPQRPRAGRPARGRACEVRGARRRAGLAGEEGRVRDAARRAVVHDHADGGRRRRRSDHVARRVDPAGRRAGAPARRRGPAHRQAYRLRRRHSRHG